MGLYTKVRLEMTTSRDGEKLSGKMVIHIAGSGGRTWKMAKEYINHLKGIYMKVNGTMIFDMALDRKK